ncbi:hypothetical protein [Alkalibacterium sp. 20]|uniref:hypothetical protein n=1 Tax=Alkalibacterium sp. 20 TaxID=1798803 RepID=UPI003528EA3F
MLGFFGKDIPVAKGLDAPLIRDIKNASRVHGETGMEGYDFKKPTNHFLLKEHARNHLK